MRTSKIAALDFFEELTSSYARKWFFWGVVVLILVSLLLLQAFSTFVPGTWPPASEVVATILTDIVSGSVIVLLFYLFYVCFFGVRSPASGVTVTRSQDIPGRMLDLPLGTSRYLFWGRSGAFFRAKTLLTLDEQATRDRRNVTIEILLPDPKDSRLVEAYREICASLGEDKNANSLLPNVLATATACAVVAANNKFLEIRLYLSHFLPGFRLDLSDNGAILTQDDEKKPALYFEAGSEFYEMFRSTMFNEREVSREVQLRDEVFQDVNLDDARCEPTLLEAFGVQVGDRDQVEKDVLRLIKDKWYRYK